MGKITNGLFSNNSNEWETPKDLFEELNNEFNFTLDPCSTDANTKCEKHYTKEDDGLSKNWQGETVFVNPPYGREISAWVEKCYKESKKDNTTIVLLIPARTDTKYFHKYIYKKVKEIRFIKGRLKFTLNCIENGSAPFPSMIVVF